MNQAQKPLSPDNGSVIDQDISKAAKLSLEHDEKAVLESIEKLKTIAERTDLTQEQYFTVAMNLATAYRHRGEHKSAIELLRSIETPAETYGNRLVALFIKVSLASSLSTLGAADDSVALCDEVLADFEAVDMPKENRAQFYLEIGKILISHGEEERARDCWERTCKILEGNKRELEHYARAKANLGIARLFNNDPAEQERGVKEIEESSAIKRSIGDLSGLASNYCNLGLYYWRQKRYGRSISFTRRDLHLSRSVGDLHGVGTTLTNMGNLFTDLGQLTRARQVLREAADIALKLEDKVMGEKVRLSLERTEEVGRGLARLDEKLGLLPFVPAGVPNPLPNVVGAQITNLGTSTSSSGE